SLALTLFAIVPHAADVEWLFSGLGDIQSVKRSRLTVQNFEMLGMLRNHYVLICFRRGVDSCWPAHSLVQGPHAYLTQQGSKC
ncbi:hypothetical protein JB92DRAFT_2701520, partial [Gautieria morchelliformis]